jgi:opacity protein-like surface antigen
MAHSRLLPIVAAAAALAAVPGMAPAQGFEPLGWYVGASRDDTHTEVYRGYGWEVGPEVRGLAVRGGLELNRHFAVEFEGRRARDLEWIEHFPELPAAPGYLHSETKFDMTALQVSAIGTWHWGSVMHALFEAGVAHYSLSGEQTLGTLYVDHARTRPVGHDGTELVLGLGLGANVAPNWQMRVEYQYFGIDRAFLGVGNGDDPTIDSFSIGFDYHFGKRHAAAEARPEAP